MKYIKQILLICAAVVLVGCGDLLPTPAEPKAMDEPKKPAAAKKAAETAKHHQQPQSLPRV